MGSKVFCFISIEVKALELSITTGMSLVYIMIAINNAYRCDT